MNNKIVKLTIFLLLVTGISGLAVGLVNGVTAPIIAEQNAAKLRAGYSEVYPGAEYVEQAYDGTDALIDSLILCQKDGADAGVLYLVKPQGYGGEISLLVGFDIALGTTTGIKVLAQSETPGLGARSGEPEFALRFVNKAAAEGLAVVKTATEAADEVQAITAATVTSTAVVEGVNAAGADFAARFGQR